MFSTRTMRLAFPVAFALIGTSIGAAATPAPCAPSDLQIASAARLDAEGTLKGVINFVRGNDKGTEALLLRWFGSSDGSTATKVAGVFGRSAQWLSTASFYCLYQNDGSIMDDVKTAAGTIRVDASGGLFAYVDPVDLGKIYLGLQFFRAPPANGYDSKLGTLIHEMTHFWITGDTNREFDDIYPEVECLDIARTNPAKALGNAQNYEYFVEEWLSK
jgi:Lysine-specific metallo-endopeptidase